MITEELLQELGFVKTDVSPEEAGDGRGFYYYSLDFDGITLITNSDDEASDSGSIEVYLFESELNIKTKELLVELVNVLNKVKKENE
jgi:hypothetical protein